VLRILHRADGDIVRGFLSVTDLLADPQLVQLYAYLAREDEATVQDVIDDLEFAQETAYSYLNRLVDAGVVDVMFLDGAIAERRRGNGRAAAVDVNL